MNIQLRCQQPGEPTHYTDNATGSCWACDLTWPHLTLPDLIWPYLTSCDLIWPYLTLPDLMWPHLTSPDLNWPHMTLCYLTPPHMNSPDLMWPHLTSCYLNCPHVTSCYHDFEFYLWSFYCFPEYIVLSTNQEGVSFSFEKLGGLVVFVEWVYGQ